MMHRLERLMCLCNHFQVCTSRHVEARSTFKITILTVIDLMPCLNNGGMRTRVVLNQILTGFVGLPSFSFVTICRRIDGDVDTTKSFDRSVLLC